MAKYEHERMLLFQAATSEYGIVVATEDYERDLQALYAALRAERATLPAMELRRSPWKPKQEIWIVKKSAVGKAQGAASMATPQEDLPPPAIGDITLKDLGLE